MFGETRQARVLRAATEQIGRVRHRTRRRVAGDRQGARLELSLLWGPAWRVRAELPPLPAVVDIFSQGHAPAVRGALELGDPAFDRAYGVDGAPADLVRSLLDEPMRQRVAALGPDRIRIGGGAVEIVKRHHFHFDERREIDAALELAVELVRRTETLARETEAALVQRARQAGEPYRGGPDARAVAALAQARDEAVKAAARRTRRRWNKSRAAAGVVLGGWMIFEVVVQLL